MTPTANLSCPAPAVVVYADFNCPFSAAASARASKLEAAGWARIDWHAVEHDPAIPAGGQRLIGADAEALDREIEQIRREVGDEDGLLRRPSRLVNTHAATLAYSAVSPAARSSVRQAIFTAYWRHDADIADPAVLADLGAEGMAPMAALAWRRAWTSLPRPIVPAMILPDGHASRGLGALARLDAALSGDLDRLRHA